jgi:hypothetical protein
MELRLALTAQLACLQQERLDPRSDLDDCQR